MTAQHESPSSSPPEPHAHPPLGLLLGGGALLHQVGRELSTVLDRMCAEFDVTTQQAALLVHAAGAPMSPSGLTQALGTDTAGVTRLLDRLEAKGLLRRQRHPDDRRAIVIELTEEGRALVPQLPPIFGRVTTQMFAGFTAEEITRCRAMLERMLANLRG